MFVGTCVQFPYIIVSLILFNSRLGDVDVVHGVGVRPGQGGQARLRLHLPHCPPPT